MEINPLKHILINILQEIINFTFFINAFNNVYTQINKIAITKLFLFCNLQILALLCIN